MVKSLFVAWQDPDTRAWFPVGRLMCNNGKYCFSYTKGALASNNFIPFGRMTGLYSTYESETLFPLFTNRILEKSRPEYNKYLTWLGLTETSADPFLVLSLTEGLRGTDGLEIFPCPEPTVNNKYKVSFFLRSLRYLNKCSIERANSLKAGDQLLVMRDVQNKFDRLALALRTDDPATIVGYCPRYLCSDFGKLVDAGAGGSVEVVRVNLDAPLQMRVLCNFESNWPANFSPCSDDLFLSLDTTEGNACAGRP